MSNPELYLILHKVRGEPAFDIAQRLCQSDSTSPCQPNCGQWHDGECGAKDDWIIPTSGHKAYPYDHWRLSYMKYNSQAEIQDWPVEQPFETVVGIVGTNFWNDLPDHYSTNSAPAEDKANAKTLLSALGLPTKVHSAVQGTLKRRI